MSPHAAALTIARKILRREPTAPEINWIEQVIRSVLPREIDVTPVYEWVDPSTK